MEEHCRLAVGVIGILSVIDCTCGDRIAATPALITEAWREHAMPLPKTWYYLRWCL